MSSSKNLLSQGKGQSWPLGVMLGFRRQVDNYGRLLAAWNNILPENPAEILLEGPQTSFYF
jgi:hypothetical protein